MCITVTVATDITVGNYFTSHISNADVHSGYYYHGLSGCCRYSLHHAGFSFVLSVRVTIHPPELLQMHPRTDGYYTVHTTLLTLATIIAVHDSSHIASPDRLTLQETTELRDLITVQTTSIN